MPNPDAAERTLNAAGHAKHWWGALAAIPQERSSAAYARLSRVWFDHTRFHGNDTLEALPEASGSRKPRPRYHEFVRPHDETNLTVTLWENFSIFSERDWLPLVYAAAGFTGAAAEVRRCAWSYEWQAKVNREKGREPMCDIVVEHEDIHGHRGILVVEAKALGAVLGAKDLDLAYYMEIPEIAASGERASLLFLIDEACRSKVLAQIGALPPRTGVLTWQQLGAIQIQLALRLNVEGPIRQFVAGAIQYQFAQHNIRPARLAADYLSTELSMEEIDALPTPERQLMSLHYHPAWKLPEGRADGVER
jgi:hypothetical protein